MQAENRMRKPPSPAAGSMHGHGAHPVCHSCGWTFPNPHPSAKQRRTHRKHCGKMDGFPHGGDDGGINGNDDVDDDDDAAGLVVTPAAAAPLGDKDLEVPDRLCDKEIQEVDAVNVVEHFDSALSANDAIDSLQDFDTEALPDVDTQQSGGLHESILVKRAVSEELCTEIADLSEAPAFALADGNQVSIEMGTDQSSSCTTSNGISSLHAQAVCESQERRKKEEIIAKVEKWSSGKQHTPLKTLLVEANHESKQKRPNVPLHKLPVISNRSQAPQDEGFTTGTLAPTSEHLTETSAKKEVQKEWNSPARLPINRNDKRKVKGKPQWVPFLCCPSLN